jgi:thiol-disulfide isomerase/thioredoxin
MSRSSRVVVIAPPMFVLAGLGGCDANRADGTVASSPKQATAQKIPRLVDLGAGKCIPCKAMAPILEELGVEYAGRMEVQSARLLRGAAGLAVIAGGVYFVCTAI